MLRIALIGTGSVAGEHVEAIVPHAEQATLIAAVDPNAAAVQAFCQQYQIAAAYTNSGEMLRHEHPDIVVICSPPHTHAPLAIQAMQSGAHVVCEKPMVLSLAELDQIERVEAASGRTCSSIFQWRYGSAGKHVKRLMDSGEAGKPLLALCHTLWYRAPSYYRAAPWRGSWALGGGGVAMGLGIHAMDFTLWLMGGWQEVQAITRTMAREVEVETVALAQVQFMNGALGSFVNSVLSPRQNSYVRLDLQHLTIELDHLYHYGNQHWRFTLPPDSTLHDQYARWQTIADDEAGMLPAQWSSLITDFMTERATPSQAQQVRPTIDFLASLYKSAFTGQPIVRGSIQPDDAFYHAMNGSPRQS